MVLGKQASPPTPNQHTSTHLLLSWGSGSGLSAGATDRGGAGPGLRCKKEDCGGLWWRSGSRAGIEACSPPATPYWPRASFEKSCLLLDSPPHIPVMYWSCCCFFVMVCGCGVNLPRIWVARVLEGNGFRVSPASPAFSSRNPFRPGKERVVWLWSEALVFPISFPQLCPSPARAEKNPCTHPWHWQFQLRSGL